MKNLRKIKPLAVLLTVVLLLSTLAVGCGKTPGSSRSDSSAKKVTLNEVAHSIFYAPMYVAIEEGYFADEGIDLELVTGYGADKTMTALLTHIPGPSVCISHFSRFLVISSFFKSSKECFS